MGDSKYQAKATSRSISRPNSLLTMTPEREPINFDINMIEAPPEIQALIEHIKIVAEQFLYHWKTFPICESCSMVSLSNLKHSIICNDYFLLQQSQKPYLR